jgi:hypothetical protein
MEDISSAGQSEAIYRYAAKKILEDLRRGVELDTPLQQHLSTYPLFNYCRSEIVTGDKGILKGIVSSDRAALPVRRFAIRLLRRFKDDPDVKTFFFGQWLHPSAYEMKIEMLWSLLGYKDLPEALYAEISNSFNAEDLDKWLPLVVEKLEGDQEEKAQVKDLMKKFFNL